jgi:hypothetical protein
MAVSQRLRARRVAARAASPSGKDTVAATTEVQVHQASLVINYQVS